jgi:hypothetical protein
MVETQSSTIKIVYPSISTSFYVFATNTYSLPIEISKVEKRGPLSDCVISKKFMSSIPKGNGINFLEFQVDLKKYQS